MFSIQCNVSNPNLFLYMVSQRVVKMQGNARAGEYNPIPSLCLQRLFVRRASFVRELRAAKGSQGNCKVKFKFQKFQIEMQRRLGWCAKNTPAEEDLPLRLSFLSRECTSAKMSSVPLGKDFKYENVSINQRMQCLTYLFTLVKNCDIFV